MRIQAFLTAAAVNPKRLAGAVLAASLTMLAAIANMIEMAIPQWRSSPTAQDASSPAISSTAP